MRSRIFKNFLCNGIEISSTQIVAKARFSSVLKTRIDTSLLMTLRRETGASLQLCREAIEGSGNDLLLARLKLTSLTESRGEKRLLAYEGNSSEGFVGMYRGPLGKICIVKLRCMTDFVARSSQFAQLAEDISRLYLEGSTIVEGQTESLIKSKVGVLQEPISVDTIKVIEPNSTHLVGTYLHNKLNNGMGTIASIVEVDPGHNSHTDLQLFVDNLARHIGGLNPRTMGELLAQVFLFAQDGCSIREELEKFGGSKIINFLRVCNK
jgi:translation elongation factor EF-Ts